MEVSTVKNYIASYGKHLHMLLQYYPATYLVGVPILRFFGALLYTAIWFTKGTHTSNKNYMY